MISRTQPTYNYHLEVGGFTDWLTSDLEFHELYFIQTDVSHTTSSMVIAQCLQSAVVD